LSKGLFLQTSQNLSNPDHRKRSNK